jgi:hypothetical protein
MERRNHEVLCALANVSIAVSDFSNFSKTTLGNVKTLQDSLADESDDGCPVCLEPFVEGAHFTTVCGHKFCTTCWDDWKKELVDRIPTCPLCRKGQPVASYGPSMLQADDPSVYGGVADSSMGLDDFYESLMFRDGRSILDVDGRVVDYNRMSDNDVSDDDGPVYRVLCVVGYDSSVKCSPTVCSKWERITHNILAMDANEIKVTACSHAVVQRVLWRLTCEFGQTDAIRWIANDLAFNDPTLHLMHNESALYAYTHPIALKWNL